MILSYIFQMKNLYIYHTNIHVFLSQASGILQLVHSLTLHPSPPPHLPLKFLKQEDIRLYYMMQVGTTAPSNSEQ